MKKILITGGTGFIGRNILSELSKSKKYIIFSTYRKKKIRIKNVNWIKIKTLKSDKFKDESFDVLLDLAWYDLDNYNSLSHINSQVHEHLALCKNLLKSNNNMSLYIIGTSLEYGFREGKLNEKFIPRPHVNYSKGKNMYRKNLIKIKKKVNFKLTWLRPFYIYGDNQQKRTLYSQFKRAVKKKHKKFKMSKGDQKRDYLDVRKVAKILINLINKNTEFGIVNICSGKPVRIIDLVESWKKNLNSKIILERGLLSIPKHEPYFFYGDNKKLKMIINEKI